jgi:hypothetical protein
MCEHASLGKKGSKDDQYWKFICISECHAANIRTAKILSNELMNLTTANTPANGGVINQFDFRIFLRPEQLRVATPENLAVRCFGYAGSEIRDLRGRQCLGRKWDIRAGH